MRRFLAGIGAIVALTLWAGGAIGSSVAATPDAPPAGCTPPAPQPGVWQPFPCKPLEQPVQISAKHDPDHPDHPGILNVELTAAPDNIMVSGARLNALPFKFKDLDVPSDRPATLNGPTLHASPGDRIHVTFVNQLGVGAEMRPTNIHYHGLHVSPNGLSDNIFRTFDSGRTYQSVVDLVADQPVGTYWYHVHLHGDSSGQVMGGLSGLLIIDGLKRLLPADWRNVPDRQLALRDVQTVTPDGTALGPGDTIADRGATAPDPKQPSVRLVNALYQPTFDMKAKHYELWRLANIGTNVYYKIHVRPVTKIATEPVKFAIIAEDGLPVWRVTREDELLLPPGKRFDVLVMAATPTTYVLETLPYPQAGTKLIPPTAETLATITVQPNSDPVTPSGHLPTSLAKRDNLVLVPRRFVHSRRFEFSYPAGPPFKAAINDKLFEPGMFPEAAPYVGTVEEWTLVNKTKDDHPFHIHVNGFQVMSVNGVKYTAHGHQDIVNIPKKNGDTDGQVVIRQRFKTFTGWFVFHCHILQHEDAGMMATIQVRHRGETERPAPEGQGTAPHGGDH